ncbi:MAG: hypothetical protein ACUVRJ_07935 [Candidatus Villigracilaceae bacterium]
MYSIALQHLRDPPKCLTAENAKSAEFFLFFSAISALSAVQNSVAVGNRAMVFLGQFAKLFHRVDRFPYKNKNNKKETQ